MWMEVSASAHCSTCCWPGKPSANVGWARSSTAWWRASPLPKHPLLQATGAGVMVDSWDKEVFCKQVAK
jgi:hypothetical protein